MVGLAQNTQFVADHAIVQREGIVFPQDRTVQMHSGDGILISIDRTNHAIAIPLDQVDQLTPDEDIDDVQILQVLQTLVGKDFPVEVTSQQQISKCALGIEREANAESASFDFNPQAAEFTPNAQPLPKWARIIEDIYHEWDVNAFAWEGEARAAHFLTWYVAPGIGRMYCLPSRRVTLRADFWAWREQLRQLWRNEMQIQDDFNLALAYPPPNHIEPGIAGHIILTQYNTEDWSSVLISVHDPALNQGMPVDMAHSIERNGLMRDVLQRIGYIAECTHHAQCQVRVRNA